jgi:hypothetical protein
VAPGRIVCEREQLLGVRHLSSGKSERRAIKPFAVGGRLPSGRIFFQRGVQVAATVRFDGNRQRRLRIAREFQFLGIDHGGIVKAPLDQVGCLAHWHLARRSSRPDFRGVPGLQTELATAGLNVHFAVDHAQNPNAILAGLDVKFGSADSRHCGLITQFQLPPPVAVENVEKT